MDETTCGVAGVPRTFPACPRLRRGLTAAHCAGPLDANPAAGSRQVRHDEKHRAERDEHVAGASFWQPPSYDGWEIEEELRHAFRVLGPARAAAKQVTAAKQVDAAQRAKFRLDAGQRVPGPHARKTRRPNRRIDRGSTVPSPRKAVSTGDRLAALFVGTALSLGTMAFGCGLALLGWSAYSGSRELWTFGARSFLQGRSPWCWAWSCNWTAFGATAAARPPGCRRSTNKSTI